MTTTRTLPASAAAPRVVAAMEAAAPRVVAAMEAAALARFLEAERLADAIDSADWMADAWADLADLGAV